MTNQKTIILAAGGTGGHVFPAIALAHNLQERGYHPILLTDKRIRKFATALGNITTKQVMAGPLTLKGLLPMLLGLVQSLLFLHKTKPLAVVGFGGYPSFPGLAAGVLLRLPTILHEQNSYMGKVNRLFARVVDKIATSFPVTYALPETVKDKVEMVGNPVRPAIKKLRNTLYSTNEEELYLLITGGSQGTSIFSEVVPQAIIRLPIFMQRKLTITQQCRPDDVAAVNSFYQKNNIRARVAAFIDDMHRELARADMVIARSGASTCAELAVAGRPAILVPYPHAAEDHQTTNALWLKSAGAAILLPQEDLTPSTLANILHHILQSPDTRRDMADAARNLGMPDAEAALADIVLKAASVKHAV